MVYKLYPDAIKIANNDGSLPLHIAAKDNPDINILRILHNLYPDGIKIKNNDGQTPLDIAHQNPNKFLLSLA